MTKLKRVAWWGNSSHGFCRMAVISSISPLTPSWRKAGSTWPRSTPTKAVSSYPHYPTPSTPRPAICCICGRQNLYGTAFRCEPSPDHRAGRRHCRENRLPARQLLQGAFSASGNGILVYSAGSEFGSTQLTWFDRSGRPNGTAGRQSACNGQPSHRTGKLWWWTNWTQHGISRSLASRSGARRPIPIHL